MPILSVSGEIIERSNRRPILVKRQVRVGKPPVSSDSTRPQRIKSSIDGKPLAVGSSAVYAEYQRLRKTPEFKVWWKRQYAKQHAQCYYCQCDLRTKRINVEHIRPMSRGGTNNRKNLVLACSGCNRIKGSTPLKHKIARMYRDRLKQQVKADRVKYRETCIESQYQSELALFYRNNF